MIRVEKRQESLRSLLKIFAGIYDKKIETEVSKMMAMVEPMFTLVIGVTLAILIVAIAGPIMNMTGSLR